MCTTMHVKNSLCCPNFFKVKEKHNNDIFINYGFVLDLKNKYDWAFSIG